MDISFIDYVLNLNSLCCVFYGNINNHYSLFFDALNSGFTEEHLMQSMDSI